MPELNAVGLRCPDFLMMVRKTLRGMGDGDVVDVITDDLTSVREIPKLCVFLDHTLLDKETTSIPYRFKIKKGL